MPVTVAQLIVYPVKGARGISLDSASIAATGTKRDPKRRGGQRRAR